MSNEHLNETVIGNPAPMEPTLRAPALNQHRPFEAAQDGLLILDGDTGRITDVNPFLTELLGFSREEMVGKTVGELSSFKDIVASQARLKRLQQHGNVRPENLPLETRDGRKIVVEFLSHIYQAGDKRMIQCNIRDVTERKAAETAMSRLAAIVETSDDAFIGMDLAGIITNWNRGAEQIFGGAAGDMVGTSILRLIPGDRQEEEHQILSRIKGGESVQHFETQRQTQDGRLIDVSVSASPIKDGDGQVIGVSKIVRDLTLQKVNARELVRLSRLHAALSQINQAIVWTPGRAELFEKICRALVEVGGFRMAWIARPEAATQRVRPVAQCGDRSGLLSQMTIYADDRPEGRAPTGTAIREGRIYVCNDFTQDPNTALWREAAHRAGFRSSATFPIRQGGGVWGALTIYSDETGFFRDKEIALLEEVATDVSYALDNFAREAARQQAEAAVRASEGKFSKLFRSSPVPMSLTTIKEGRYLDVNTEFLKLYGWSREEVIGHTSLELNLWANPEDRAAVLAKFQENDAVHNYELDVRTKSGQIRRILWSVEWVALGDEDCFLGTSLDLTERLQAEREIQRQAAFAQFNPNPVLELSATGEVRYFNAAALQMANALGHDHPARMLPPNAAAIGRDCLATAKPNLRLEMSSRNRTISWSFFPVAQNEVVHCYAGDITERKQAEAALNYERDLWRALLNTSPDRIYFKDTQSRFIKVSQALAHQVGGKSPDEIVGKTDFDLFTEAHARPAYEDEQEIIRTGRPLVAKEEQEVWPDGHVTWASSTKMPMREAGGKIIGIMGISRDITEHKRVQESNVRLAMAVEQAAESILITDTRGTILYANPAFEKISGYTRMEAIGQNPRVLKSGKQSDAFYRQMWEVLGRGEIWTGRFVNRRKDGTLFEEETTISPVRDAAGAIVNYVAVKRDVTREAQLEEQIRQAQKMEAVGQLAGGVAHDFNNLLGVIMGYSDLLVADFDPDSPLRTYAEEIRHAAERAKGVTQQLLVFSRKQTVQPVVLDLNGAVKDLEKMLRRLIGENIEMVMVPGKEIGRIQADSGHIGQVLMNLAINARDAMPNGGQLTIATGNVTLDENHTRTHPRVQPGNYVRLAVSDTGTGMTPEVKAHIFEALFTTKPAGKGTGLGLATCQTIVHQSGGHIDVESEVGKGTTFRIYFPRVDRPVEAAAGSSQAGSLPRGTETLLVVEDEASLRHLASQVLEALGYQVLRANNGQDALQLVREYKGSPVRLVVTDVVMPRMGGKVMADWLKTTYPELKILFTSGYTDDALTQQGVLGPGVAFLPKPYTPGILARKVRAMLDNETDTAYLRKPAATTNQSQ